MFTETALFIVLVLSLLLFHRGSVRLLLTFYLVVSVVALVSLLIFIGRYEWGNSRSFTFRITQFKELITFDIQAIENVIRTNAERLEISAGKLIHPIRLACSGVTGGPGLFEMLEALGRETVVRRLDVAVEWIKINFNIKQEA